MLKKYFNHHQLDKGRLNKHCQGFLNNLKSNIEYYSTKFKHPQ